MVDIIAAAPAGRGSTSQLATGAFLGSGNAISLALGFNPRNVTLINETQGKVYRKIQGNSPNTCIVSGGGSASAVDNTGLITFPSDAGLNEPGSTVLIAAGVFANGDKGCFAVEG